MKFKRIVGIVILVVICSCAQKGKKTEPPIDSGLLIENGINRGVNYTDSQGTDYSIRYIPVTITNDSTIPIRLQIAFREEYDYPSAYGDETFKVFCMPEVWAMDGVDFTHRMFDELGTHIDKPGLIKSLEPGGKAMFAIGTLYPRPTKSCGVLPSNLFMSLEGDSYKECDSLITPDRSTSSQLTLGLKLDFCRNSDTPGCNLISCGEVSYPE